MSISSLPEAHANAGAGVSLEIDEDRIAILEFDQPDSENNRFTPELLERLDAQIAEILRAAQSDDVLGLVLTSGKRESFIVGVDVGLVAEVTSEAEAAAAAAAGQRVFNALNNLPITTVAAINGTCLGGGAEIALACTWRVAAESAAVEIGFPEVNLGIIPGFGGTQRLPRILSLERALPMILTGRTLTGRRALSIGLVDALVPETVLREVASRWALERGRRRRLPAPEDRPLTRRIRRLLLEGNPLGRRLVFRQASKGVRRRTGGHYPAPLAAIEAVRKGLGGALTEGLAREAELVGRLVPHPVTRNLLGLFFQRQAARRERTPVPVRVRRLGILGAGVMGGSIAQLAAYHGVTVRLRDIAVEPLETAMRIAQGRFAERQRAGRISVVEARDRMGLISPTLELTGLCRTDMVIEAVVERLDVKRTVLAEAETAIGPDTVLATNTSSLMLGAMQDALRDPSRLVGLHFFNPVHRMPLVEVVRGPASRPEAVQRAVSFATALGKVPVVVGDGPGFLVNRVLNPYLNEAVLLLEEGTTIEAIDSAMLRFGMPMGPLRLLDEIGLDVAWHAGLEMAQAFGGRIPATSSIARLQDTERLGRKGRMGFYLYPEEGAPCPDPTISELIRSRGDRAAEESDVVDRCALLLLNEACHALDAGIVTTPLDADMALVFGAGFAPFRGGVFRYGDARGIGRVRDRLAELADEHGPRFQPAPHLQELAESGGRFYPASWPHRIS